MTKATGSSELVERLREGVQALYHEPGQSTPIYAIVPANQTMRKAADRIAELEARLARAEEALKEAKIANETIRLNRDGQGSGRVKVATAMHRIEQLLRAALQENDRG
ncbi:MAG: hypothetical protein KGL39_59940 [Patescibacteria group bacterium]|nr:hypothetical protein [Patescibacteria group bacterium]